jgi:hypothetical protein
MTASETFEQRIVSVANTGSDSTATKVVCITNGDLLRYKILTPNTIVSLTYSGVFNSSTVNEIILFNLPTGIKYEDILNLYFRAYYDTSLNSNFKNGICWASDQDSTIYFANGSSDNPSSSLTFKIFRRTNRMTNAPFKITIQYIPL